MFKKIVISVSTLIIISIATETFAEEPVGLGASLGTTVMRMKDKDGNPFYAGSLPMWERMSSIFTKNLFLQTGTTWTWGYTHFFFDWTLFLGLRYYPTDGGFSVYTNGEAGTFFFNNVTTAMHFGADYDFKIDDDFYFFLGGEYFRRREHRLAEFVEKEQWYITSDGFAIRFGVRARVFDIGSGPERRNSPLIL